MTAVSWDVSGIKRELEREAQKAVDQAARDIGRELNGLSRTMQGQPVSTIKPRVKRILDSVGGSTDDETIEEYAEGVRDGRSFTIKPERLRL